jgi:hypothetical protein
LSFVLPFKADGVHQQRLKALALDALYLLEGRLAAIVSVPLETAVRPNQLQQGLLTAGDIDTTP